MSENENQAVSEPVIETMTPDVKETEVKSKVKSYVAAGLLAAVIILGVLFVLEKEGRSGTNIFGGLITKLEAGKTVAVVNGEEIKNPDLLTSIQQFTQVAAAQGVDTTSAEAQAQIKNQALDVLINTRLLKQDAIAKGYSIPDEVAKERLETIKTEIGGETVLAERMAELGITLQQLERDIKDELLIQQLLETIFAEADISVSEEEVLEFYNNAGGAAAGLPAVEEVRAQIEAQIKGPKEQAAIDNYLMNLKTTAQIEIK